MWCTSCNNKVDSGRKAKGNRAFSAQGPSSHSLQFDISHGNSGFVHTILNSTHIFECQLSSRAYLTQECSMNLPAVRNRQVAQAWQMCGQTVVPVLVDVSSSAYMKRIPSCMSLAKPVALVSLSSV